MEDPNDIQDEISARRQQREAERLEHVERVRGSITDFAYACGGCCVASASLQIRLARR